MQEWEEERAVRVVLYKKDSAKVVRLMPVRGVLFLIFFLKGYYLV